MKKNLPTLRDFLQQGRYPSSPIKTTPAPAVSISAPQKSNSDIRAITKTQSKSIHIGNAIIGGQKTCIITGTTEIRDAAQMLEMGFSIQEQGGLFLRATINNISSENEISLNRLRLLRATTSRFGLQAVLKVRATDDANIASEYCDVFEIHPNDAINFNALTKIAKTKKPIILHRSPFSTITGFRSAIKHLEGYRCTNIILVDSGIRSFDPDADYFHDLATLITIKNETGYPTLIEPSQSCRDPETVLKISAAAIAIGVDGIILDESRLRTSASCSPISTLQATTDAIKSAMNYLSKA